jgi:hypothetical protein
LHLYAYCANDPVNFIDPSGHWAVAVHKQITNKAFKKLKDIYKKYKKIKRKDVTEKKMYNVLKWLYASKNKIRYYNGRTDKDFAVKPWSELTEDEKDKERAGGHGSIYHRSYHGWYKAQFRQGKLVNEAINKYDSDREIVMQNLGRAMHTLQDRFAHRRLFENGKLTKIGPIFDRENDGEKWSAGNHSPRYNDKLKYATKEIRVNVVTTSYNLLSDFVNCYMNGTAYEVYE